MKKRIYIAILSVVILLQPGALQAQLIQGTYAIKNVQTGMLLRIKDANSKNGTPLVAYLPVNWRCVTWDFIHVEADTYHLRNLFTNKTFQARDTAAGDGALLEQQPLVKLRVSQQYDFIAVGKNIYLIKARGVELYVTPVDKSGTTDSGIMLAKRNDSILQQWIIYKQKPSM